MRTIKGEDQPVRYYGFQRICCYSISILYLVSLAELTWSQTSKDRFSHDEGHMYITTESMGQTDSKAVPNKLTNNEMESIVRARSTLSMSSLKTSSPYQGFNWSFLRQPMWLWYVLHTCVKIVLCLICLSWFFTSHQQSFSYKGTGLPGLNQY